MDLEKSIEISAAAFEAAAASLSWAERARRSLPESPPPGSDTAEVVAWAEDTLMTMTELSELMAEAWERIAEAMESVVASIRLEATVEPTLDLVDATDEPSLDLTRRPPGEGRIEPVERPKEDLLPSTSFLDALERGRRLQLRPVGRPGDR